MDRTLSSITYSLCLALWREAIRPRLPLFQNERQATGYQGKLHQFYMRVFPKWFFLALEGGKIHPVTLQPLVEDWNDLVMESDLIYFQKEVREKLKAPIKSRIDGVTQNIPPVEVNFLGTPPGTQGPSTPKEVKFDRLPLTPVPIKVTPLTPIQYARCS